jgi:hypothetical protein
MSTLATNGNGPLEQGSFQWHTATDRGVEFRRDTPREYWLEYMESTLRLYDGSKSLETRLKFFIADALNFGEEAYGE